MSNTCSVVIRQSEVIPNNTVWLVRLYYPDDAVLCIYSGKGAAVFAEGLSGAVASGLGKVRYLTSWAGGFVKEGSKRTRR